MSSFRRWAGAWLALAAVAAQPRLVHAGNLDSFYLGNDAALQGGAITANASGGGAIWYNPAGLARLSGLRVDASASAYALRLGGQPDLGAGEQGSITRLTTTDFQIVPSTLTLTHRVREAGLGFGVFVPNQYATFLRTRGRQPPTESSPDIDVLVDVHDRFQEYYAGPSIGFRWHPAIDFGFSMFVHYRNQLSTGASQLELTDGENRVRAITHTTLDWQQLGLQTVWGLQLRPHPQWRIGFAVRSGSFRIINVRQQVGVGAVQLEPATSAEDDVEFSDIEFSEEYGFSSSQITAPRHHAGVSYDTGDARLALELSYQFPLYSERLQIDTRAVPNARLGGTLRWSESLTLGGGLFTDRSPVRRPIQIGERRVDYYGLTLAADLNAPYLIATRKGEQLSPPAPLLFGTTVALSYAVGFGELQQAKLDASTVIQRAKTDLVVHELTLHFGTTLTE